MLLLGKKWANFGDLSDFTNLMSWNGFLHYYHSSGIALVLLWHCSSIQLALIDAKQRFIVSVFMTLANLLHKKSASQAACTFYQRCC